MYSYGTKGWGLGGGGGPFERILLLTIPILGTRCAAAGGVLVRNRLRAGTTIALLPLFLDLTLKFPAEAPRESPGEWNGRLEQTLHEPRQREESSSQPVLHTAG